MNAKSLLPAASLFATAFFTFPAHADAVWNFNNPPGAQGQSHNYAGSDGTLLNAQAFGPNGTGMGLPGPVQLFGKNDGVGETGVGLTNDPSGQNEITMGSFIQLTIDHLFSSTTLSFMAGSTTGGEAWAVFGTNTPGTNSGIPAGATNLLSCNSGVSSNCDGNFTFNSMGFNFLDVTEITGGIGGNILLAQLDGTVAVPGPIVGAGLPGLVVACGGLLALARRRVGKLPELRAAGPAHVARGRAGPLAPSARRLRALIEVFGFEGRGAQVRFAEEIGVDRRRLNNVLVGYPLSRQLAQIIIRGYPRVSTEFLLLGRRGPPLDQNLERQLSDYQKRTGISVFTT